MCWCWYTTGLELLFTYVIWGSREALPQSGFGNARNPYCSCSVEDGGLAYDFSKKISSILFFHEAKSFTTSPPMQLEFEVSYMGEPALPACPEQDGASQACLREALEFHTLENCRNKLTYVPARLLPAICLKPITHKYAEHSSWDSAKPCYKCEKLSQVSSDQ